MIARPLSRRAAVGGIVSAAALSGCSFSNTSSASDNDVFDRDRLTRAHDMSQQLLAGIDATTAQHPNLAGAFASARALHAAQVAQFAKSARMSASPSASSTLLTLTTLHVRQRALAGEFRGLALQADRGDVAALLASAAAGIEQALARPR